MNSKIELSYSGKTAADLAKKMETRKGKRQKISKNLRRSWDADELVAIEMKIPASSSVKRGQPSVRKEITAESFNR